ncbi:tetratricopeptide repeat protein [uncultured Massilia sp.]|uniref:tetratricopeptide repeat protein n=1 Tax=uncultured Massilia sp. TaxID=169973 RepID=UPI0025F3C315|nr:tetratricopeptide repeat protein [uncultured Massilia sp.]
MLQDLDARGTPAGGEAAYSSQIKPVAATRGGPPLRLAAIGAGGALAVAAVAWVGWQQLHRAQPAAVRAAAPRPPQAQAQPVPVAAVVVAGPAQPAAPAVGAALPAAQVPQVPQIPQVPVADPAPTPAPGKDVAPMEPDGAEARATRRALAALLATRQGLPAAAPAPTPSKKQAAAPQGSHAAAAPDRKDAGPAAARAPAAKAPAKATRHAAPAEGRQETPAQRAENAYRRALASLQEGRMGETVAALEEALRIEPGHEAARQTLVGLLVEAGRGDEAMRQAQAGLVRDPRQPALAMLLARLQIERGGSGIDVLMRTLPYAGNDAEYHGFLAGALQRQQRHREAAEQYLLAVRAVPANGVWWMGLGMSLQAEKRNAEALEAFQKARATGALSQDLAGFVERRIQQLAH